MLDTQNNFIQIKCEILQKEMIIMDMFSQDQRILPYFLYLIFKYICEGIPHIYLLLFLFLKVLAQNSGYDLQDTLVKVQTEHSESKQPVGIDLNTGKKVKKNQQLNKKRDYAIVTQNLKSRGLSDFNI